MEPDAVSISLRAWLQLVPVDPPQRPVWPAPADAGVVLAWLTARMRRAGAGEDADDVAAEAVLAMAVALGQGRVDADSSPRGYLAAIAMNRLTDRRRAEVRRRRREVPVDARAESLADPDDPYERHVEQSFSAEAAAELLASADATTRKVLGAFLDLAALRQRRPAADEVAAVAGVSRKTVFAVLARLRRTLDDDGHRPTGD